MSVPNAALSERRDRSQTIQCVEHVRNLKAHAQKPDLVFQRNGRIHLNLRGGQFSRLLAVEVCGSAGSDCVIFSKYVDHSLKMSLQGGKKRVKRSD